MIETDELAKEIYVHEVGDNDQRELEWDFLGHEIKRSYENLADWLLDKYIIISRESEDVNIGVARENHYLREKNRRIRDNAKKAYRRYKYLTESIFKAIDDLPLNPHDALIILRKSLKSKR
jgi:hypothetical protein